MKSDYGAFHKPVGAVTTAKDDKNRKTIYDYFPSYLPRVMPVGRLDLNSEGLLLLTNSGELKESLNCQALNLVGYIGFVSRGIQKKPI